MTRCECAPRLDEARTSADVATADRAADTSDEAQPLDSPGGPAWISLLALVVLFGTGVAVALWVGLPDVEALRVYIADAGPLAPALFVVGYALLTLFPLPKNAFAALAGAMFGLASGVVVVLVAALLGAATAFVLSRKLGRDAIERITGDRVGRVDALLSRHGVVAVLWVRLVPVLPFTAINYAAGLTSVRIKDYATGTAIGIVPGTVAFVALGAYGTSPGSWPFVVSGASLALLSAGGLLMARRSRNRRLRLQGIPTSARL